jgi:recombination protein RecT
MSKELTLLHDDVYNAKETFSAVCTDRSLNFEKEAGFAIQSITANDYACQIAMRNRQSVVNAVTNIAAIGISLNPAKKQAYLVPRDGRICLDISYIGLMDLAIQSGGILWGQAELVYEQDDFKLNGFDKPPTHGRNPFAKERGALIGAYVVVKTKSADYLTTCMSIEEIYDIRNRSSAWKAYVDKKRSCPWVTDEGEMAKKTVIKRAYKTWPKVEGSKLELAIHHLNTDGEEGLADIQQQQGGANGGKPTSGALEAQSIEAQAFLRELAANVDAAFRHPESGVSIAFDLVKRENLDSDQTIALWTLLASDVRRELKKEGKARNEALNSSSA